MYLYLHLSMSTNMYMQMHMDMHMYVYISIHTCMHACALYTSSCFALSAWCGPQSFASRRAWGKSDVIIDSWLQPPA